MSRSALFFPMFAQFALTFWVAIYMYRTRVKAVKQGQMETRYFRTYNEGTPTDEVVKTGRHFTNLFEVPVLFFVACLFAIQINIDSALFLAMAWIFVAARYAQAYVHLGKNRIGPRIKTFGLGLFTMAAMWLYLFVEMLQFQ